MAIQLRAMDAEVGKKIHDRQPQDVFVTKSMSVSDAVGEILARTAGQQISRLTIIAHGIGVMMEANIPDGFNVSVPTPGPSNVSRAAPNVSRIYGGYGIAFGRDELTLATVAAFGRLNGRFTNGGIIVLFGCAAADTGPYLGERMSGDGPALMKAIARYAGAPVRASDSLQDVSINWYLGTADRGAWVGRTFLFMPDGRQVDESALPMSVY